MWGWDKIPDEGKFLFCSGSVLLFAWYGFEVSGIILLRHLKGAIRPDHSKDMSVHVSTCISYDLNSLTSVVWKLWF
jgi:hypothetical protein